MHTTAQLRRALLVTVMAAGAGCGSAVPAVVQMAPAASGELPPLEEIPRDPKLQAYTLRDGAPAYIVGPGDKLEIILRDVSLTRETVTVRPDGNISFALVENVRAAGRTAGELDSSLTSELSRFLRNPKIDVAVLEFHSKVVSLLGSIQTTESKSGQGRYPLKTRTTVLDLILEAGGTTPASQLELVRLVRGGKTHHLDLQRVLQTGEKTHNVVLQGDDIVIVPGTDLRSKKVIVLGEIQNPSVYMFSEGARFLEALGQAGGFTAGAQRDDIRIIRIVDGKPSMFSLDFNRVAAGEMDQNVALKSEDVIFVPRSFMGDVNDVIAKIDPLLRILLLPATYRDLYTTGGGLRIDTGEAESSGSVFTRSLPGTAAGKATTSGQDSEEKEPPADEDEGDGDRE